MTTPPPTWTPPTREQVEARSDYYGLGMSDEMLDVTTQASEGLAGMYEAVGAWWQEALPQPQPVPVQPGDDPYQATEWKVNVQPTGDGPLGCLRLATKDSIRIAGAPLAYGSRLVHGHIARESATVVERVLEAGASITHIARADDLGLAITGDQNFHGPVLNPWDTDYTTWGSSSGAAALVAAEEVDAAVMVDQAGSARVPGAGTGLAVILPTRGIIPMTGVMGFTAAQDRLGFGALKVPTLDLLANATAGPDGLDMKSMCSLLDTYGYAQCDLSCLRVGVVMESLDPELCDPAVAAHVEATAEALRARGARVRHVSIEHYADASALALILSVHQGVMGLLASNSGYDASVLFGDPELAEQFALRRRVNPEWLARTVQLSAAGAAFDGGREAGFWAAAAQSLIPRLTEEYMEHFRGRQPVDLLLTPTAPSIAPDLPPPPDLLSELLRALGPGITHTCAVNLMGLPAGQVPAGMVDAMPVGAQFIGAPYSEKRILCAMHALEPECGWPSAARRQCP